jgi:ribosome-associated protein
MADALALCHSDGMARIVITRTVSIDSAELVESFTRAGGPGGQHVNTTDSAVLLRFDVAASPGLPDRVKMRLAELAGSRMTRDGVLILRADGARSQEMNRRDVRERLVELIREATIIPKARRATKPTRASQTRRVDAKARRGAVKSGRGRVRID